MGDSFVPIHQYVRRVIRLELLGASAVAIGLGAACGFAVLRVLRRVM